MAISTESLSGCAPSAAGGVLGVAVAAKSSMPASIGAILVRMLQAGRNASSLDPLGAVQTCAAVEITQPLPISQPTLHLLLLGSVGPTSITIMNKTPSRQSASFQSDPLSKSLQYGWDSLNTQRNRIQQGLRHDGNFTSNAWQSSLKGLSLRILTIVARVIGSELFRRRRKSPCRKLAGGASRAFIDRHIGLKRC
jgi:hypothetical protein